MDTLVRHIQIVCTALLLVCIFGVASQSLAAEEFGEVEKTISHAVVMISAYEPTPVYRFMLTADIREPISVKKIGTMRTAVSSGTGFVVSESGYILTNKHVVEGAEQTYRIRVNGEQKDAEVVYRDPEYDIALMKIEGDGFDTLPLATSSAVTLGDKVIAVGNAWGEFLHATAEGTVIALDRTIIVHDKEDTHELLGGLIEFDARLYPGDSGGPLLNDRGEVVGINTAAAVRYAESYALPIASAERALLYIQKNDVY